MKKLFLLLAAAFVFVACNDDELDMEYYSQLSPDELIATGEGVEYLVRAYGNVDQQAINALFPTYALHKTHIYWKGKSGWFEPKLNGTASCTYVTPNDQTYRCCFIDETGNAKWTKEGIYVECFYYEYPNEGNTIATITRSYGNNASIVAHHEKIVVIQKTDEYGRCWRYVFQFRDDREKVLSSYYDPYDESLYID